MLEESKIRCRQSLKFGESKAGQRRLVPLLNVQTYQCFALLERDLNKNRSLIWQPSYKNLNPKFLSSFPLWWERVAEHFSQCCVGMVARNLGILNLLCAVPQQVQLRHRKDLHRFRKMQATLILLNPVNHAQCFALFLHTRHTNVHLASYQNEAGLLGEIKIKIPIRNRNKKSGTSPAGNHIQNTTLERIAHDLNKPLSNLMMSHACLQQLLIEPTQSVDSQLQRMANQINEMSTYTHSLLQIQSGQALQPQYKSNIRLLELLEAVLDSFQNRFQSRRIKVVRDFCMDFLCDTDTVLLGRILNNLFSNACQFCQDPGLVYLNVHRSDGHWQLDLEDNGPGLNATDSMLDLSRQNIGRQGGGWGIGLAASLDLAQELGGSLECLPPRYGTGARFLLVLPTVLPQGRQDFYHEPDSTEK